MKTRYCPWDHAYEVCGGLYTQEEIDDMTFGEIQEIIGYD